MNMDQDPLDIINALLMYSSNIDPMTNPIARGAGSQSHFLKKYPNSVRGNKSKILKKLFEM